MKKEMIAMLLAGGQGSRLGILTRHIAKPAVSFGGKYRIIDFPLSNCINSGLDTVGILTQYMPLRLNRHIGIGVPWDLDKQYGGITILAPHVKGEQGEWYTGTANAIFQNIEYIDETNPEYVLILSGDHIYKMDYSKMLRFHKKKGGKATIAVLEVPYSEAGRFGIMNTREDGRIYEFEEKPKEPKSNLASMGIYIFTWKDLRESLIQDSRIHADSDFGKHIIPSMIEKGEPLYAYEFSGYWKDVGTIESYWEANMELIGICPEFNLYEDFWKIYTNFDHQPPQYTGRAAVVKRSFVSEGCEVYGEVVNSILGQSVVIGENAVVRDSIIMKDSVIGCGSYIERCIIDEESAIGENVKIGLGENIPNIKRPNIYNTGITVIGEKTNVPPGVSIGKNCVLYGGTKEEDFEGGALASGGSIIYGEECL